MKIGPCPIGETPHNGTWREKIQDYRCMRHAHGLRHERKQRKPMKRSGKSPQVYNEKDLITRRVVHQQPCLIAAKHRCFGVVRECHIKHRGMGSKQTPLYRNVWPGCDGAHTESHTSVQDFERKYQVSLQDEADRLGDIVDTILDPEGAA